MAYIYQITNDINGKIYIGKTEKSIEKRWKEHCSDYQKERCKDRPLYRAINKYGIEHFHIELLEETDNPSEREIFWIEKKQSFKNGYNATLGGDGKRYLDYDLIYSTYEVLQNATEVAKKLNISVDSVYIVIHQRGGVLKTAQTINKELFSKAVKMFDKKTNEYIQSFSSLTEASQYLIDNNLTSSVKVKGISTHIRECANGIRKSAYGFIWKWQAD